MSKANALAALACFIYCNSARIDDPFFDEWERYFQRLDTISVVAGDARDVNAVTHIIDPWPRYVRDRRIPANGERMVGVIDRYKNPRKLGATAPTLAPIILGTVGGGGGAGTGGGGAGGGAYGAGP